MGNQYGYAHKQQRLKWKPTVDAGLALCHAKLCLMPTRHIKPGSQWHLGHNEDGTRWTGPEHPKCNTTEGAVRGNNMRRGKPQHHHAWDL